VNKRGGDGASQRAMIIRLARTEIIDLLPARQRAYLRPSFSPSPLLPLSPSFINILTGAAGFLRGFDECFPFGSFDDSGQICLA